MAVATGPVVIPDYNDDEDAEEYIRNVKTIVDSATADLRTQMDNVTQLNEQSDGRYESRKSEMDRYLEEEKQNAQVEAALGLQLDELVRNPRFVRLNILSSENYVRYLMNLLENLEVLFDRFLVVLALSLPSRLISSQLAVS